MLASAPWVDDGELLPRARGLLADAARQAGHRQAELGRQLAFIHEVGIEGRGGGAGAHAMKVSIAN